MKFGAVMDSGGMIHTPSFMKIDSGIQRLLDGGTQAHTDTETRR
jgi:hypothetical protein